MKNHAEIFIPVTWEYSRAMDWLLDRRFQRVAFIWEKFCLWPISFAPLIQAFVTACYAGCIIWGGWKLKTTLQEIQLPHS